MVKETAGSRKQRRRTATKRDEIISFYRGKILSGSLASGEQLPTHEEVRLKFKTGSVTVQKAFDILAEQGFVNTIPGHLSVVSEKLPSSSRIAVVIPGSDNLLENRFFMSLFNMVKKKQVHSEYDFEPYLINLMRGEADDDDSFRLSRDASSNALKGVVLATTPTIEDRELKRIQKTCPIVLLRSDPADYSLTSCLFIDHYGSFFEKSVELAKASGRRQVALFLNGTISDKNIGKILKLIADSNLEIRPEWLHGFDISQPKWAANVAGLLFSQEKSKRPDTLFIMDDNLVEDVSAALKNIAGLSPDELLVVAHANYPEITKSHFPAKRVGFDVLEILEKSGMMIDRLRQKPGRRLTESVKAVHISDGNTSQCISKEEK